MQRASEPGSQQEGDVLERVEVGVGSLNSCVPDGPTAQVSLRWHVGQGTASCVTAVLVGCY